MIRFIFKVFLMSLLAIMILSVYHFKISNHDINRTLSARVVHHLLEKTRNMIVQFHRRIEKNEPSRASIEVLLVQTEKFKKVNALLPKTHIKIPNEHFEDAIKPSQKKNNNGAKDQFNQIFNTLSKLQESWGNEK
ncbi:MAG TPA: hypothetical protein ENI07_02165 [Desulfobacterales bacterium]|nr:hypothetical protein [Desulfobacterales bacterium]